MKKILISISNFKWPVIFSLIATLPFAAMELINRWRFNEGFPFQIFIFLWLSSLIFGLLLQSVLPEIKAGNLVSAKLFLLLIRIALLIVIARMWAGLIIDQMPCFLGVPNCD